MLLVFLQFFFFFFLALRVDFFFTLSATQLLCSLLELLEHSNKLLWSVGKVVDNYVTQYSFFCCHLNNG